MLVGKRERPLKRPEHVHSHKVLTKATKWAASSIEGDLHSTPHSNGFGGEMCHRTLNVGVGFLLTTKSAKYNNLLPKPAL